jgi:hypothetical protein
MHEITPQKKMDKDEYKIAKLRNIAGEWRW